MKPWTLRNEGRACPRPERLDEVSGLELDVNRALRLTQCPEPFGTLAALSLPKGLSKETLLLCPRVNQGGFTRPGGKRKDKVSKGGWI